MLFYPQIPNQADMDSRVTLAGFRLAEDKKREKIEDT